MLVEITGVDSASLQQDKDQIEVTGNDVDVVLLTTLLRKSVKFAEVVSVNPVGEQKKEEKKEEKIDQIIVGWPQQYQVAPYPYYSQYYEPSPSCSIM